MNNGLIVDNTIRLSVTFSGLDGNPVAPTTVVLKLKAPSGAVVTMAEPDVVNTATGAYQADVAFQEAGQHAYRWEGTGNVTVAAQGMITIGPSLVD
jgi:hypothetical protein